MSGLPKGVDVEADDNLEELRDTFKNILSKFDSNTLNEMFKKDYGIDTMKIFKNARESSLLSLVESYALGRFKISANKLNEGTYINFKNSEIKIDVFFFVIVLILSGELNKENLKDQILFAIKHEIHHYLFRHYADFKKSEQLQYINNIAQDAIINETLHVEKYNHMKMLEADEFVAPLAPIIKIDESGFEKEETGFLVKMFYTVYSYPFGAKSVSSNFKETLLDKYDVYTSNNIYNLLVEKLKGQQNDQDDNKEQEQSEGEDQPQNGQGDDNGSGKNKQRKKGDKDSKGNNNEQRAKGNKGGQNRRRDPFQQTAKDVQGELEEYEKEILDDELEKTFKEIQKVSPGSITGIYEDIFNILKTKKQISWRKLMKKTAGYAAQTYTQYTSKRLSKRFYDIPGNVSRRKGKVYVGVDVSGSVSDEELNMFFNELKHLSRMVEFKCYLFDTEIKGIIRPKDFRKGNIKIKGRGGTNPKPFYDLLPPKSYSIILTDGGYIVEGFQIPKKHTLILTPQYYSQTKEIYEQEIGKKNIAILKNIKGE
jgi:predicted metal-dependent peptidase